MPKKQSNKRAKEVKNETPKKTCLKCEKNKTLSNFFKSNSDLHGDELYPVCKSCLKENLDIKNTDSVKDMLLQMNRPFIYDSWEKSIEEGNRRNRDIFGTYMKNVMLNYKDYTWKDSIFKKESNIINSANNFDQNKPIIETHSNNFDLTDNVIDKWGEGYTTEEYRLFEKKWNKLIDNYGEKTSLHTEGLLTYIRFRVKEELATAKGELKEAKDWGALASKAAQDAKINVSQLSKSDISGGVDLMTQLYEAVESEVGIIPQLPQLLEQPYDDADMIIWSIVNYTRRLEDKPIVKYRDIWDFYDEMLQESFEQKGYNEEQVKKEKEKRNNVFKDLSEIYIEPLYEDDDDG